jgi:uncharacterized protein YjbJ (UPF0337 family)
MTTVGGRRKFADDGSRIALREHASFPFRGSALEEAMDKDRIIGSAKEVKGKIKEAVGKAVGDAKLESEGKADRVEGKVQNVIGGLKDTLKGK